MSKWIKERLGPFVALRNVLVFVAWFVLVYLVSQLLF